MDFCLIAETSSSWLDFDYIKSILMVFGGLGFVIFVHELGHFLAAKACGVKCEKFYVGFDVPLPKIGGFQLPSKLFHVQYGETEYGIGILPLGGYVKMLGQDDDPRKFKEEQERAKALSAGTAAVGIKDGENGGPTVAERIAMDPRSYPAKSVPQRMLIISAGVIMNLIFAVIMGAAAYGMGVIYTPTIVGSVTPGLSGWSRDVRPGDKFLQIGKNGRQDEHLRFNQDLIPQIMLNGGDSELDLKLRRGEDEKWVALQPSDPNNIGAKMVGIASSDTTTFDKNAPVYAISPLAKLSPELAGATVVAINDKAITDFAQIQNVMAQHPGETLKFTVQPPTPAEDKSSEKPATKNVEIPAQARQSLGLVLKLSPIVAIRDNSPAQSTGLLAGDEIVTINGQPVGDPFTLSQRMLKHVGETIDIQIARKDADGKKTETIDRKITPQLPLFMDRGLMHLPGPMMSVETLGLAFNVLGDVIGVEAGSPAEQAGIKAGDQVVGAQFLPANEEQKVAMQGALEKFVGYPKTMWEQVTLELPKQNWVYLDQWLQFLASDTKVALTYNRDNQLKTVSLSIATSNDSFVESRMLNFTGLQETRVAASVGEAWALGFRETKEKLNEVFNTLKRLVTGRVSATNLGGPLSIFMVARREASQGLPTLLIFLTFLSANLALLNFLPIPVLDGGHMVFLAAEGLRGKPIDENMQGWALMVGMVFLLSLMVFVFGLDIHRLFQMFT